MIDMDRDNISQGLVISECHCALTRYALGITYNVYNRYIV